MSNLEDTTADRPSRSGRPLVVVGLLVLAAILAIMVVVVIQTGELERFQRFGKPLPVHGTVGDFELTTQSGRPLIRADLDGQVWIADFIFTRCESICPRMTATMAELARAMEDAPTVRFVSFTVDPAYDTYLVLADYAARYQANAERWYFLTGRKEVIYPLLSDSFHLSAEGADGAFVHSNRFILIDAAGRIRGYYDSTDEEAMRNLRAHAIRLAREARSS